ncbi:MAG: malate dehydrogenase [Actinobacteria bacterium]|nr:MAG: malate dehydrogenase [Actinomycetota bacterium]
MRGLPKVGIVGAGQVGATAALLLVVRDLADVTLIDVVEGLPQGKALDMMQSRAVLCFEPRVEGSNSYEALANSDVVVITAGLPRKPGMSRADLLSANAGIVSEVVAGISSSAPEAVIVVVTNPLDVMAYLAWRKSGYEPRRVLGMGGVLDSARFSYYVSERLGIEPVNVEALVVGSHGEKMLPLVSSTQADGMPLVQLTGDDVAAGLVERTRSGGAEVVSLLKTGSAYYAPAASIFRTVKAILTDEKSVLPTSTLLSGEYGLEDVFLGVPARIGRQGVEEIVKMELDDEELAALRESAGEVADGISQLRKMGALS